MDSNRPVLWELRVSNYSEKARFALDCKGIAYERRRLPPGAHVVILRVRGRGVTVPVLDVDGRSVRGSAAIVAELERIKPEPALVPREPELRATALELERFFDERGHDSRRVYLDPVFSSPDLVSRVFLARAPEYVRVGERVTHPITERVVRRYYGIHHGNIGAAQARVSEVVDRIESQLAAGGGDYLVGDRFTVADLTAAALFGPVAGARDYPGIIDVPLDGEAAAFHDEMSRRPGMRWIADVYERHRRRR